MDKIKEAYEIGKTEFFNNGTIVPCQSKELMVLLKGEKFGNSIPIMKSFQKGFINA